MILKSINKRVAAVAAVLLLGATFMAQVAEAQPKARRNQANAKKTPASALTTRAQISFPTSAAMDEDVVWQRWSGSKQQSILQQGCSPPIQCIPRLQPRVCKDS